MEENKKNNSENQEPQRYSDSTGSGALSSVIFMIITFIVMFFLAKHFGY